ncbi:MAG TPA: lactate permease LctP family transporter [Blastocatellia bacterium]|nr:lactate permease LctP family transporter [Blastocatellia bacterium]
MTWVQSYNPLGNFFLSALAAALPIVVLLGLLGLSRARAHVAALAGLLAALSVAVIGYRMPATLALAAVGYGAAYGLFPIGWIVLCAIFVYDITVRTGKFEVLKAVIAGLASDRRIQVLLIAFSFGAFMEGAAGFGTPVAISAAMLMGLGFRPLPAAGLSLLGNTAPVAFGALGTPIIALAGVTGLPLAQLTAMAGRQLPLFSLIIPFWLVWSMSGWKGVREVWPACLTSGLSFALCQFAVSNFYGPSVVDIVASIVSLLSLLGLLSFWQPRSVWRFPEESKVPANDLAEVAPVEPTVTRREALGALTPWIVLSVLVFLWGIPQIKALLDNISVVKFSVPHLDKAVIRVPPVVAGPKAEAAVFTVNWLSATGTALLLAGLISGLLLGLRLAELARVFAGTLKRVSFSLLTISSMMALGYVTRFGGLDATMGLAFARTGFLFPFFSPILGWLGVALTGSDTSSNILFGNLQQITARQLGVSPVLAAAANSSGGVMGKMIDAQSIVVAGVAVEGHAKEGEILRYVFFQSLTLAILVGLTVLLQAYVLPGIIP